VVSYSPCVGWEWVNRAAAHQLSVCLSHLRTKCAGHVEDMVAGEPHEPGVWELRPTLTTNRPVEGSEGTNRLREFHGYILRERDEDFAE